MGRFQRLFAYLAYSPSISASTLEKAAVTPDKILWCIACQRFSPFTSIDTSPIPLRHSEKDVGTRLSQQIRHPAKSDHQLF